MPSLEADVVDAEEKAKEAETILSEEPYEMNLTEALLASALQEGIIDIVMATGEAARQNDKREAWVKLNIPDHWSRNILADPGKADQYFLLRCPLPYAQAFFLFWAEKLQTKMVSVAPGILASPGDKGDNRDRVASPANEGGMSSTKENEE